MFNQGSSTSWRHPESEWGLLDSHILYARLFQVSFEQDSKVLRWIFNLSYKEMVDTV